MKDEIRTRENSDRKKYASKAIDCEDSIVGTKHKENRGDDEGREEEGREKFPAQIVDEEDREGREEDDPDSELSDR